MIKLSVNVNKIATLRNARGEDAPSVTRFAQASIDLGVAGITVHPRPDERHICYQDVLDLRKIISNPVEYNIEGYPNQRYFELIAKTTPDQATLVPDSPDVITSNAGWDAIKYQAFLQDIIAKLKTSTARASLFIDPDLAQIDAAKAAGADRIELYTKDFADHYADGDPQQVFNQFAKAAQHATDIGLGVNAGHDLNLKNLVLMRQLPGLLEVSIGHAIVCDALQMGWAKTIKAYLAVLADAE